MSYKHKAVKFSEIPEKESKKRGYFTHWANSVFDDFWNSDDEAWQIFEDEHGKAITKDNVVKFSNRLRTAAYAKNKELDGGIKVAVRKGNVYIYAEDN